MIVRKMTAGNLACALALAVLAVGALPALAQDAPPPAAATATQTDGSKAADTAVAPAGEPVAKVLEWKDYKVKGYSLSFYGGAFSGTRYLDLLPLGPRTVLAPGAGDIIGYDGNVLPESLQPSDPTLRRYNAPRKEIKSGTAFGGRIGIYVADDFHLDLVGNYMSGHAVTTMLYNPDSANPLNEWQRIEVDEDPGFRAYKGGVSLMYDATPAKFLSMTPTLGFGIGGVINRFSELKDRTALYLEGNFGLSVQPMDGMKLIARADVAVFAFEVQELGYSNMVSYKNLTIGAAWFLDTVPEDVRAKHKAAARKKR